ncbi:MAG: hypothetical protein ACLP78_00900 [Thermoplasmata archaeon]
MNRTAQHKLAERTFASRHVRPPARWTRASTTSPFDLMVLRPDGDRLRATFIEIKTARGRRSSDLSDAEAEFGQFVEVHGSPYVIARYRVVGRRTTAEQLYRPFVEHDVRPSEVELQFEVSK